MQVRSYKAASWKLVSSSARGPRFARLLVILFLSSRAALFVVRHEPPTDKRFRVERHDEVGGWVRRPDLENLQCTDGYL